MSTKDFFQDAHIHINGLPPRWRPNFVTPYFRAYEIAFTNFNGALESQAKSNKFLMDLALSAFSIAGGALLTRVFAKAALKSVASDVALNVVCKNNLDRAFNVMSYVDGNETASFIVGKLWDAAESRLTTAVKDKLKAKASNFDSLKKFAKSPGTVKSYLEDFVDNCTTRANDAVSDIEANSTLNDRQKMDAVQKILDSQFCKGPTRTVDEASLSTDIELVWWMNYVLNMDYVRLSQSVSGVRGGATTHDRISIPHMPSAGDYPTSSRRITSVHNRGVIVTPVKECTVKGNGMGTISTCTWKTVEYRQFGLFSRDIRNRINTVYKQRKGKALLNGTVDKSTLMSAERAINQLGHANIDRMTNSLPR